MNNNDFLHEQIINISKAGAYDIISKQVGELKEQNTTYREALKSIQNELADMDINEVITNPALLIKRISKICADTLTQNKPN